MEDKIKAYLLKRPECKEDFPFGPDVAVMKVWDKMFATYTIRQDGIAHMNLKCDPHEALALRDIFEAVIPGYHMNKRHWNTVILNGSIPDGEVERMIDRSYGLVVSGLKKAQRQRLETIYSKSVIYR